MMQRARYFSAGIVATLTAVLASAAFFPAVNTGDIQAAADGENIAVVQNSPEEEVGEPAGPSVNQINTANKAEVRNAYITRYQKNDVRMVQNYGSNVWGCQPGYINNQGAAAMLESWNFLRGLNGLNAVMVDVKSPITAYAQAAAMVQARNGRLSHTPAESGFACATDAAIRGSRHGNLAQSTGHTPAQQMLWYYIDYSKDPNPVNDTLGHRLFMQDPQLSQAGLGVVNDYTSVQVRTGESYPGIPAQAMHNPSAPTPAWISWPSQGYFPKQLLPSLQDGKDVDRWSFSAYGADLSQANAAVFAPNGQQLPATVIRPGHPGVTYTPRSIAGYSTLLIKLPALNAYLPTGQEEKVFTVRVSGVRGTAQSEYSYQVRVFDPTTPLANQAPQVKINEAPFVGEGYRMANPINATITGWPTPTVQWQERVNGGAWQTVATTLEFTPAGGWNASRAASTEYRVVASNSLGQVASNPVKVEMQAVASNPVSTQIGVGGSAVFAAAAAVDPAGQLRGTSYSWQQLINGQWQAIPEGGNWAGTKTSQLVLKNTPAAANGMQVRVEIRSHSYKLRGYSTYVNYSSPATVRVG